MPTYDITTRVAILERDTDRHDRVLSTVVDEVEQLTTDMAVVKRDVAQSAKSGAFWGGLIASTVSLIVVGVVVGVVVFVLTN